MRLVAQRVRSPATGQEGINSFCYLRGPSPGLRAQLINKHIEVPPPGNRVRSFLDITIDDQASNLELEHKVTSVMERGNDFPIKLQEGETRVEFDIEEALAPGWRRELIILLLRALEVRI